ncbi:MAG: hypothetical protein NTW87_23670, partial [Planctomycetota bacterium]|nr:hypothetical protein [Planctomycetota bacterium]
MSRFAARLFCICAVVLGLHLFADDTATRPQLTVKELAVLSEAVAVARVGMVSAAPAADGGAAALWIERSLKGRLRGGR